MRDKSAYLFKIKKENPPITKSKNLTGNAGIDSAAYDMQWKLCSIFPSSYLGKLSRPTLWSCVSKTLAKFVVEWSSIFQ